MKAIRVLEYEGPPEWIQRCFNRPMAVHGELRCGPGKRIREVSITYRGPNETFREPKSKGGTK